MKHVIAMAFLCSICSVANAYELATHGRITYHAYLRSALAQDSGLLKNLGLDRLDPEDAFGKVYYDVSGDRIEPRNASTFEESEKRMPDEVKSLSLPGWLLRGAIREDDWAHVNGPGCNKISPNPQEDGLSRPRNHFYDPVNDSGLSALGEISDKAPDWALGTGNFLSNPPPPDTARKNHYTILDAREALYRALTGRGRDASGNETTVAPTKAERDKYWATTFRALGDVVHLVEDMAQPQHTRNDPHLGCHTAVMGEESVFEAYIDARARGASFFTVANQGAVTPDTTKNVPFTPASLHYGDTDNPYPLPRFTNYASFFTTRQTHADIRARQGLADYSNRGFFSAGKNLDPNPDAPYPYPNNNHPSYGRTDVTTNWENKPLGGTVTLLTNAVPDAYTGTVDAPVPLTTYGIWDQFLEEKNLLPSYTLNRYNYDAMANLLIPRAVAYSAGLIDYFFRGRLEAQDAAYTDTGIRLRLKNAIDPGTQPHWKDETLAAGGTLTVAYRYKLNEQTVVGVSRPVSDTRSCT